MLSVGTQTWKGLVSGVDRLEIIAVVCGFAVVGSKVEDSVSQGSQNVRGIDL